MIYYVMNCPVHERNRLESRKKIKIPKNGYSNDCPVFECRLCGKYYVYDPDPKLHNTKLGVYGGYPVIALNTKYKMEKDDKKRPVEDAPVYKAPISSDNTVRIKNVKDDEVVKARTNLNNIRNEYPSLATDKMSVFEFIRKVCGINLDQECVVRNASRMWNGSLVKAVEFYVRNSQYLKTRIPNGLFVSFTGRLSNGEFIIEEIRLLENPKVIDEWEAYKIKFAYDGPQNPNFFYTPIADKGVAKPSLKLTGELAAWNDYLSWKRQLAEMRIRGLKYLMYRIALEDRKMIFLSVSEGEKQLKEFQSFLRRNEVSVFSNKYSKYRWVFEFNRDYQDSQDSGIDAIYMGMGERYNGVHSIQSTLWRDVDVSSRKYKDEEKISFSQKISDISKEYDDPVFQEIEFELTERALTLIKRDLRRNGNISENTEKAIEEEFYGDGYLATTQIGDFALINRLQRAINDLANGKSAQQDLSEWLFDIRKADKPKQIDRIETWQNPNINERQKRAVEKIVFSPDVCLIQGPPGTGKTTVIAEAVYQFVSRNKRVLIASQANLAVDNALERLISNPKIRAIRLGNAKKIDDSVKNITEDSVLETFYGSIVSYVQKEYLDNWRRQDAIEEESEKDAHNYQYLTEKSEQISNEIKKILSEIDKEKAEKDSENRIVRMNALRSEKMSAFMISSYCRRTDDKIEVMLGKDRITNLWNKIEPLLRQLTRRGVYLTRVGIDDDALESHGNIEKANRIIKHVLINARAVLELYEKLKNEEKFAGESEETEHLRLVEEELRNKMMTDPSVVTEWQRVNARLKELSKAGLSIDEHVLRVFIGADSMPESERKAIIKETLDNSAEEIDDLLRITGEITSQMVNDLEDELAGYESREDEIDQKLHEKEKIIDEKRLLLGRIKNSLGLILAKYSATSENIKDKISEYIAHRKSDIDTDLDRSEWEDIFSGLEKWVSEIPDYSQEKDIFLRDYINGCNVVGVSCTENARTLSENGFDYFDVVIIDEVSKATPPELLIPMLRGRKIVLVGDHRQLPPLFNEREASYEELAKQQEEIGDVPVQLTKADFEKYKNMVTSSLFERYFETGDPYIKETLTYQYRMHSDIMDLINQFYGGELRDGNEDEYTEDTKAHYLNICSNFGTDMIVPEKHAYWFDSSQLAGEPIYEQRKPGSPSLYNQVECETILELLRKMENQYANSDKVIKPVSVGVISFYYDQVSLLRQKLKKESFHTIDVEVNTVDRFQGKEKEVIFVSLVRNKKNFRHNLDSFIAAYQRINVAFSRAQNLLVIVGATDMYAKQPVEIKGIRNDIDKEVKNDEDDKFYPYRNILEIMNTRGTYFTCDEVIPESKVDDILMELAKLEENGK